MTPTPECATCGATLEPSEPCPECDRMRRAALRMGEMQFVRYIADETGMTLREAAEHRKKFR